jgi:hypothetical protein
VHEIRHLALRLATVTFPSDFALVIEELNLGRKELCQ